MSKRTTVTLEDDVLRRLESEARRVGRPFKEVLNEAIRRGLDDALKPSRTSFQIEARDMGLLPGVSVDDVAGLLERLEGVEHR